MKELRIPATFPSKWARKSYAERESKKGVGRDDEGGEGSEEFMGVGHICTDFRLEK